MSHSQKLIATVIVYIICVIAEFIIIRGHSADFTEIGRKKVYNVKCAMCNKNIYYKFGFINLLLYNRDLILECPECKNKTVVKINTLEKKREIDQIRRNFVLTSFINPLTLFVIIIWYFPTGIIMKYFIPAVICCLFVLGITIYSQYKQCCRYIQYYIYLS